MISLYSSISVFESSEEDFEFFLKKLYVFELFKPILSEFEDKDTFLKIVKFIVYGFSPDSTKLLTSGNTWSIISKNIYQECELPNDEENFDLIGNLKSDSVRESVERFLDFSNNENWTQYSHYKTLRKQFLELSLSDMKKATGEIDIEAKMKAVVYSKDLLKMMEDARDGFIQNHPKLRGSVEAFNKATNNTKNSRSPGSYAVK